MRLHTLLGLLAWLGAVAGLGIPEALASTASTDDDAVLVATRSVTLAPYDVTLPEKVGLLEAGEDRELAFQTSGRIVTLAREGTRVEAGDVVAALDTELEQARLRQAELRLVDAHRELARMRGLRDADAASRKLLESADTAVLLRIAERDEVREALARRTLVAPFAGIVTETRIDADEIAAPGETVALLMDLAELRLEVGVPGHEISRVERDARAIVRVPALGSERFEGSVKRVAQAAGLGRHLFEVEVRIPNLDGRLRPGMGARARLVIESVSAALVVPLGAVVERSGRRVVFFAQEGHARAASVDDAILQGDELVLREDAGDAAGDTDPGAPARELIVRGQRDLFEGGRVRVDNAILAGTSQGDAGDTSARAVSVQPRANP